MRSYGLCPRSPLRVECQADSKLHLLIPITKFQFQTIFVDLEPHTNQDLSNYDLWTKPRPIYLCIIYQGRVEWLQQRTHVLPGQNYVLPGQSWVATTENSWPAESKMITFQLFSVKLGHPCSQSLWDVASWWWNHRETMLWGSPVGCKQPST